MSEDSSLATPRDTVQNHLCLLPDQLSIFIRYGQVLSLTLFILLLGAIRYNPSAPIDGKLHEKYEPLLPTSEFQHSHRQHDSNMSKSSCIQNGEAESNLSTRKMGIGGYGYLPASSRTSSPLKPPYVDHARSAPHNGNGDFNSDDWGMPKNISAKMTTEDQPPATRWAYFRRSVWRTAWPVLMAYIWLLWNG